MGGGGGGRSFEGGGGWCVCVGGGGAWGMPGRLGLTARCLRPPGFAAADGGFRSGGALLLVPAPAAALRVQHPAAGVNADAFVDPISRCRPIQTRRAARLLRHERQTADRGDAGPRRRQGVGCRDGSARQQHALRHRAGAPLPLGAAFRLQNSRKPTTNGQKFRATYQGFVSTTQLALGMAWLLSGCAAPCAYRPAGTPRPRSRHR